MIRKLLCILALGLVLAHPAFGALVAWTDWTSSSGSPDTPTNTATGIISFGGANITVDYSENWTFVQTGSGENYWTEGSPAPYTGNAIIDNAPTPSELVAFAFPATHTLTFSQPIVNPILAIVSLGNGSGDNVSYDFDSSFTVLSEGQGYWGDGDYTLSGNKITGSEFHGVLQFQGTLSSISWTSSPYEFWHGITVGAVVPIPICEGDFDNDSDVDGSDLAVFAADFGRTDCLSDCEGDFDEDGDVDGSDLAVFAADFGRTDCP